MDKIKIERDWCVNAANREGDSEVGAGLLAADCPECGCPSGGHNLACSIWHKQSLAEIDVLQTENGRLREEAERLSALWVAETRENERLQEAKRRALAVADERSKENVALRADVAARDKALELNKEESTHWFEEVARLRAALEPFAAFAEKAEAFVDARAKDGGSPILPVRDFRLADFRRAREALGE